MSTESKNKPSNPPAFATPAFAHEDQFHFNHNHQEGMSLRDYFAGQALAGLLAGRKNLLEKNYATFFAETSYDIADAMLSKREEEK